MIKAKKNKGKDQKEEIIFFAKTIFKGAVRKFGIKISDRRHHMYLLGSTSTGKSTALENMIYQDIYNGRGLAIIDPHGDLAEKVLDFIPSHRINDVIYFNPSDTEAPFAFNILERTGENYKHFLVVSCLISIFKELWEDLWNSRLEYVLRNILLALLEYPGSTLLGITRMLDDKDFRELVLNKVSDTTVQAFWKQEYPKYNENLQAEIIAPIKHRVNQIMSSTLIRNILGQVKSKVRFSEIVDKKKILIVNLSKAAIGEDVSSFLGAMIITKIQMASMERISGHENNEYDFYLYIDEFHNFVTDSFIGMLSKAKEYHINLIIAHQYLEQLSEKVDRKLRDIIFNNIKTIIVFKTIEEDARFLSKKVFKKVKSSDLVNLENFKICIKLMIDGVISKPFFSSTLEPISILEKNRDKVICVSRERYTKSEELIKGKIARWTGIIKDDKSLPQSTGSKKYESKCDKCGIEIYVPFIPDGIRPVYCRKCLKLLKHQSEKKQTQNKISLKQAMKKEPISFKNT